MDMSRRLVPLFFFVVLSALLVLKESAVADSGSAGARYLAPNSGADVEQIAELGRRGMHYDALKQFLDSGGASTIADKLILAQSAWALGLVDTAREIWDEVFANPEFTGTERSRSILARAIMELQEGEYERARAYAERAANDLDASELRAQFWLVIAEALKEQGALSLSEGYYKKAIEEGSASVKNEASYLLGECQFRLGRLREARFSFAGIETSSEHTPRALRRLAEIDSAQRNYEGVLTWIEEGRANYPSEFRDGWSAYTSVSALLQLGRSDKAKAEVEQFRVQHSEDSPWFSLAVAALEATLAEKLYPELATEVTE
jgi:tetratricopeptide (TPR) repeat protein